MILLVPHLWLMLTSRIRYDPRTRNNCTHLQNQAWAAQFTDLAHAYLEFKMGVARSSEGAEGRVSMEVFAISLQSEYLSSSCSTMALTAGL